MILLAATKASVLTPTRQYSWLGSKGTILTGEEAQKELSSISVADLNLAVSGSGQDPTSLVPAHFFFLAFQLWPGGQEHALIQGLYFIGDGHEKGSALGLISWRESVVAEETWKNMAALTQARTILTKRMIK